MSLELKIDLQVKHQPPRKGSDGLSTASEDALFPRPAFAPGPHYMPAQQLSPGNTLQGGIREPTAGIKASLVPKACPQHLSDRYDVQWGWRQSARPSPGSPNYSGHTSRRTEYPAGTGCSGRT